MPDKTSAPRCYINLLSADLDRPIYRIYALQRFLEMVAASANTLVRPRLWDDPFENYVLSAMADVGAARATIGYKEQLYGQCWTLQRDSDAMWRIYSPDKLGVRVRTTVRGLLGSLQASCPNFTELSCFIGKVQYLRQDLLLARLADSESTTAAIVDPTGRGQASTLLVKRKEFSHEREVRLVYFNHNTSHTGDLYQYPFDPLFLFDEVAFDPRLSDELFAIYQAHTRRLGFAHVIRSPLYRLPQLQTKLVL